MRNPTDRLDTLLARLVDETISPQEQTELETILSSEPEAQKRYIRYLELHDELNETPPIGALPTAATPKAVLFPRGIAAWRLWTGAAACVLVGMLFASVAWAYAAPRLREKPRRFIPVFAESFEGKRGNIESGLPPAVGMWSGDEARIVGAEHGVRPKSGTTMLRFVSSTHPEEHAPTSAWGDIYRLVEWPQSFAAEAGRLRLSASFAAEPAADAEQYAMSLELLALDSYPLDSTQPIALPSIRNLSNSVMARILPLNRDGKWQNLAVEAPISPSTRYVLIHLAMVRRFPKPSAEPARFSGHFLDDIKLEFLANSEAPNP
ncbi:MAG: hypothetical protein RLZZ399_2864 [Verrucomicrobiota bacterium]|jgi:hypothetical protein